ncbi:MAG: hypothetical protein V8Q54_02420 [Alistipes senegalensis]
MVEALRAELPMVLSDTRLNREAAGHAAAYVNPEAPGEVVAALENALCNESWRQTIRRRERRRAELFSEYAVAERLMQIYTSLWPVAGSSMPRMRPVISHSRSICG